MANDGFILKTPLQKVRDRWNNAFLKRKSQNEQGHEFTDVIYDNQTYHVPALNFSSKNRNAAKIDHLIDSFLQYLVIQLPEISNSEKVGDVASDITKNVFNKVVSLEKQRQEQKTVTPEKQLISLYSIIRDTLNSEFITRYLNGKSKNIVKELESHLGEIKTLLNKVEDDNVVKNLSLIIEKSFNSAFVDNGDIQTITKEKLLSILQNRDYGDIKNNVVSLKKQENIQENKILQARQNSFESKLLQLQNLYITNELQKINNKNLPTNPVEIIKNTPQIKPRQPVSQSTPAEPVIIPMPVAESSAKWKTPKSLC